MTSICCPKSIHAFVVRLTRTDDCGVAVDASVANSRIQFDAFVSFDATPNLEAGTEITVKKANGQLCVTNKLPDQLKWLDATFMLCGAPYPALEMLLGVAPLVDGSDIVGGVLPSQTNTGLQTVQVELWSLNKDAEACASGSGAGDAKPYVHWMFPLTRNWVISDAISFANDATNFKVKGLMEETMGFYPSDDTEWTPAQITAIQDGGPMAWKCVADLPAVVDCDYMPVAS